MMVYVWDDVQSIEAMVMQNQLHWADHCMRMSENRLPDMYCLHN